MTEQTKARIKLTGMWAGVVALAWWVCLKWVVGLVVCVNFHCTGGHDIAHVSGLIWSMLIAIGGCIWVVSALFEQEDSWLWRTVVGAFKSETRKARGDD